MCQRESEWLKCTDINAKRTLKSQYVEKRKLFDKSVQRRKRQYLFESQESLLKACEDNKSGEFWKSIG